MKEQDDIQRELEGLSPELARRRAASAERQAPEGYFEQLPDVVLQRLKNTSGSPLRVAARRSEESRWYHRPSYIAGLAAAMALLLAFSFYFLQTEAPPAASLASLEEEEIQLYIEGHIEEFDLQLMLEAELVEGPIAPAPNNLPDIEEEDAEEYLYELLEEEDFEALF